MVESPIESFHFQLSTSPVTDRTANILFET